MSPAPQGRASAEPALVVVVEPGAGVCLRLEGHARKCRTDEADGRLLPEIGPAVQAGGGTAALAESSLGVQACSAASRTGRKPRFRRVRPVTAIALLLDRGQIAGEQAAPTLVQIEQVLAARGAAYCQMAGRREGELMP